MKTCRRCGESKEETSFRRDDKGRILMHWCKDCFNSYCRERRQIKSENKKIKMGTGNKNISFIPQVKHRKYQHVITIEKVGDRLVGYNPRFQNDIFERIRISELPENCQRRKLLKVLWAENN